MTSRLIFCSLLALAVTGALLTSGRPAAALDSDANASLIARGQYLTGDAGQCADCHRPNFVGGPNLVPGPPGAPWAKTVPSLRGLKMFANDADAVAFLHTAKLPNGQTALRPMPHYNFSVPDAGAIVAYLRSLE
jgi:mono/diheme cytochrome c family protein